MKKITLRDASNEQIAKHMQNNPEEWGIDKFLVSREVYETEYEVRKDIEREYIGVEITGSVCTDSRFSCNTILDHHWSEVTITFDFENVDWNEEIEVE